MSTRPISAAPALFDRRAVKTDFSATGSAARATARGTVSEHHGRVVMTTAYVGVCALAISGPFELSQPVVRLPWQSVSSVEGVLAVVFCAWIWSVISSGTWPRWRTSLTYPWMVLLALMWVSAVAAPTGRVNALHMAARLTIGFGVFLLTVNGVTTTTRARRVMAVIVVTGAVVGILTILEYVHVKAVLEALRAFRPAMATVGGQGRAGGTLQYPTIASMYLEIVFAFGLGLLLVEAPPATFALLFAGLIVIAEAITLTFTRAGLVTMAVSLGLVGMSRYRRRGVDLGVVAVSVLALLIPIMFVASRSMQSAWLRLTSQSQDTWYGFAVEAPAQLTLATGELARVPVRATNEGRLTWDSAASPPVRLSYHWLLADADRVVAFNGERTFFPAPVPPGTTVSLQARVRAPGQPGRYRLQWDLAEEGRLWFSTEPDAPSPPISVATVIGPATSDQPTTTDPLPARAVRPNRLLLWRAAARMIGAHPIFGVGPDNFRLLYGDYSGLSFADPRLHSNNMYIEMLAGGGLAGGLAFLWLMWRTGGRIASAVRVGAYPRYAWVLGIAAACVAVLIHGTVDSFLSFTPTYVAISMTLGLVVACTYGSGGTATHEEQAFTDADRL